MKITSEVFLPKTHSLSLTMRKKKHQSNPIDRHFTKYLTSNSQNCQVHQKQKMSEKLSQPRGGSEDMTCNVMCILDGILEHDIDMGSWNMKMTLRKS